MSKLALAPKIIQKQDVLYRSYKYYPFDTFLGWKQRAIHDMSDYLYIAPPKSSLLAIKCKSREECNIFLNQTFFPNPLYLPTGIVR